MSLVPEPSFCPLPIVVRPLATQDMPFNPEPSALNFAQAPGA